jgi:cytochrome c oxidase subunit 4
MSPTGHNDGHNEGHDHPSRKTYVTIFGLLALLTVLEVGVVYVPMGKTPMVTALIAMALAKAGLVALFFMHLKYETVVMRRTVLLPFFAAALYAFVLIMESAWRLGPG